MKKGRASKKHASDMGKVGGVSRTRLHGGEKGEGGTTQESTIVEKARPARAGGTAAERDKYRAEGSRGFVREGGVVGGRAFCGQRRTVVKGGGKKNSSLTSRLERRTGR